MSSALPSLIQTQSFQIQFYDTEPGGLAGPPAICRYMEAASHGQTQKLGLSLGQVLESNRMWVLSHLSLRVFDFPAVGDHVSVQTWATTRTKGIRAYRDFRMYDSNDRILAEASSFWLLLDATTRRPVRLPATVFQMCHDESVEPEPVDVEVLESIPEDTAGEHFKTHWGDLDENGHANNIRYIEWMLASVPNQVRSKTRLKELKIQFKEEVRLGEELVSASVPTNDATGFRLRHGLRSDQRMIAVARTSWVKGADAPS